MERKRIAPKRSRYLPKVGSYVERDMGYPEAFHITPQGG